MKTRDELAEALLIASVEESKIMPAATAFNLADAFVAERERRAYPPVNDAPAEAPAAEALGFVDQGGNRYLTQRGQVLDAWAEDRFGAGIYPVGGGECVVEVKLRATDQAHAERIVAAMLPVGRGTK